MNLFKKSAILFLFLTSQSCLGQNQELESKFDDLLKDEFTDSRPGATALVAIDGEIIYKKAFGMANLELEIPMHPDMVFEIGSLTKQFTAVSILILMEQGKLKLDDDIKKFIPDYPTHGHKITIHHLLTHTSGIKSYTSMQNWNQVWSQDFEPLEMIDFFKHEPMEFDPGEKFNYNNSGYFILGYIIEKVSGMKYEEFIDSQIFQTLGMNSSYYGSKSKVIRNRASGYQERWNGLINADYLSMTQPYAAGSLMSTVEDMFIWNRAIKANKLISQKSIDLALTNYELNNGEKINYGYGWFIKNLDGSGMYQHAGGIFGFIVDSIYLPDEDIFVAVFSNCNCNPPIPVSGKLALLAKNN